MDMPPAILSNDPPAIVRTTCACGNTCPGTTCKTGAACLCVTAPTTGQQTYIYRGRSFQFTAASEPLAESVRAGIRAVVDGAVPVAMPTAGGCPGGVCPPRR
jgi:hypothetical protein